MEFSPRFSLSYLSASQAQKHVTVNETFRRLDALVQLAVESRTTAAEPGSPADGDVYILPANPTGTNWAAMSEGHLAAWQDGAWVEIAPPVGWRAWVKDDEELVVKTASGWEVIAGDAGAFDTLGVNTTADATNRLAVKSDAVLFSHDDVTPGTGDMRVKLNKDAAGDTASFLFQTGFSGRAEFGLVGNDDFTVKVSPDGAAWTNALVVDKDNGYVGLGAPPERKLHVEGAGAPDSRILLRRTSGSAGAGVFGALTGLFVFAQEPVGSCSISFWTRVAGPSDVKRMELFNDGGLVVGSPTGGSKGAGTINAQAVYDDNALLSCYVFDAALDGALDTAKWDGRVPDRRVVAHDIDSGEVVREETVPRRHEPMRRFAARLGSAYDPLTLDGYARHWKEKRHLTAMPNEEAFDPEKGLSAGEWIQRLVETVEIQAVLIEQLNQRVKALEAGGRP